ncbi:MAG: M20 family metallopeptidase [Devosiaceae bacterium]|nr:M20 family metallopeptidase [Devosiaceae bacterium]
MPIINRFADFHEEITAWRRDLHENPELLFDVYRTAEKIEQLLKSFGCDEVVSGIGKTGVVGIIKGKNSGDTIGLRADMDALPIHERTDKPYASKIEGKMHACGHDGHTAMLLGAAKYLAETRNFSGNVALIFQPAEEGGGGGDLMVKDGMMERFNIKEVYGMHNFPGIPVGEFAIREGGFLAAVDEFLIEIEGVGGHAAMPHNTIDPLIAGAHIITGLQTIVSRNVDPIKSAVLSVTVMQAGGATNVIARTATIKGTVRTLDEDVRDLIEKRMGEFVPQSGSAFGVNAKITYQRGYPVMSNHAKQTIFAGDVAAQIVGEEKVVRDIPPIMGGEDFSYMLNSRPGAFIAIGQGDTAGLHEDTYDFNDEIIPIGCSYWVKLVESAL